MGPQEHKVERRLAAIFAADVVGSSRLMEAGRGRHALGHPSNPVGGHRASRRTASWAHRQDYGRRSTPGIRQPGGSRPVRSGGSGHNER